MTFIITTSMRKTAVRALRRMGADALLGAVCGGLYGFVFGGFGALARDEGHRLLSIAGTFAVCGAAIGLLVGAYSAISEASGKPAGRSSPGSGAIADHKIAAPVTAVRQPVAPGYRQATNGTVAA